MNQIPNAFVFDSLELEIWNLFVIWYLVLGIFLVQARNSTQIYLKIFIIYVGHYDFYSFACASLYSIPCRFKIS